MHKKLADFTRAEIEKGLSQCTVEQQGLFRQICGAKIPDQTLHDLVMGLQESQLDPILALVERTIATNEEKAHAPG